MSHNLYWEHIERAEEIPISKPLLHSAVLIVVPLGIFMIPFIWASYKKANHMIRYMKEDLL